MANPADSDKLNRDPRGVPNERAFMSHWTGNIMPSIQALHLTPDEIGRTAAPVLVIHGKRDRSAPWGGGMEWASLLPNARLLTIEEGAHVPWIEAPQQVFGAIDSFLNGGWPEGARSVKGTVLEPEGMESRHHSRQG